MPQIVYTLRFLHHLVVRMIFNIPVLSSAKTVMIKEWSALDGKLICSKLSGSDMNNTFLVHVSSICSFSMLFLQPASVWWIWIYCIYLVESCQHHQCLPSNGTAASSRQPRHSGWSRRFGMFSVILIFHSYSTHPEIIIEHFVPYHNKHKGSNRCGYLVHCGRIVDMLWIKIVDMLWVKMNFWSKYVFNLIWFLCV